MQVTFDYMCYAHAHGRTIAEQRELDREQWPGGCMTGYILWHRRRKAAFLLLWPDCQPRDGWGPAPATALHRESWNKFLAACAERSITSI